MLGKQVPVFDADVSSDNTFIRSGTWGSWTKSMLEGPAPPPVPSETFGSFSWPQTAPEDIHSSLPRHLLLVSEATGDYVALLKWPWISHQDRVPMTSWGPLHDTSPVWPLWPVRFPYALLPSWHVTCISCKMLHVLCNEKCQIAGPLNMFGVGWNLFRRVVYIYISAERLKWK